MVYRPITAPNIPGEGSTTSFMAKQGMNLRDLPQLLSPNNALLIKNYLITAEGGLEKRKGITELFDASSTTKVTMFEKWDDDTYMFGYDNTKLAAYTKSTDTVTDIKTDFNTNVTDGARYSDGYFFVASPQDKIGRVTRTLDYDNQTANFTVGAMLTGGTSGATAIILEDSDSGTTGTLTLGSISGTFQDGETITDDNGTPGSADADGVVGFTYTEITAAPKAKHLRVVNARLYAGNLESDPTAVQYSEIDDGSNPPFDAWTDSTTSTDGGTVYYRNAGAVNVINNLGDYVIVGYEEGKAAFRLDEIDSGGTLKKIEVRVMYRDDRGMKSAIQTKEGLFYCNSQGIWQLTALGQVDVEFSDQEVLASQILGDDFFNDANFDDASFVKDDVTNQLLLTYRQDSAANNQVLVYNTQLQAYAIFTGWTINRFINDDGVIYGAGATTAKVWQVFDGFEDDGAEIFTEFEQELSVGQLWTRKELMGQYFQGELSDTTEINIKFSIYDRTGAFVADKLELQWSQSTEGGDATGYGETAWGAAWGGDSDLVGTTSDFSGYRGRISNFQRIRVKLTSNDKVAHRINWMSLQTREKANIRRRNLTKV